MALVRTAWRWIAAGIALSLSVAGGAHAQPSPAAPTPDENTAQGSTVPLLGPAPSLGALAGKPIRKIEILTIGERWASSPTIKRVKLGDPLSSEIGRIAVRELTESGAFARGSVEVAPLDDGALLRVRVLPRRLIATVQMTGGVLDTRDTLEAADVGDGGEITGPRIPEIASRIRAFYAQHGFTAAEVTVDTSDTDDPAKVVLSLEIKPGAPRTISQRVFVIEPALDREVGELKQSYRLGRGARIDEASLEQADRELVEVLHQHAFYRAEVHHDLEHRGRYSYLYVYIESGPRLLPAFEGNLAFDKDQLEQALELTKPTEGKPAELAARLERFYVQRGFLDVEIRADAPLAFTAVARSHARPELVCAAPRTRGAGARGEGEEDAQGGGAQAPKSSGHSSSSCAAPREASTSPRWQRRG